MSNSHIHMHGWLSSGCSRRGRGFTHFFKNAHKNALARVRTGPPMQTRGTFLRTWVGPRVTGRVYRLHMRLGCGNSGSVALFWHYVSVSVFSVPAANPRLHIQTDVVSAQLACDNMAAQGPSDNQGTDISYVKLGGSRGSSFRHYKTCPGVVCASSSV